MIKVTLIKPSLSDNVKSNIRPDYPNIGIAYLSSFLKANGFDVLAIDASFDNLTFYEVKQALQKYQPDVIGLSAMTHEIIQAGKWAQKLKELFPNSKLIIGGPHATVAPVRTLKEFAAFDFAVIGEGESTLLEIIKSMNENNFRAESIKGIAWRNNGEIEINEARENISDLDALPFPNYDHIKERIVIYPIYSSRGCPYRCAFCCRVLGNKIRVRTPQNVIDELKIIVERYKPKFIDFSDETLTVPKRRVIEICDLIIKERLNEKIKWNAQSRVNGVDQDLFNRMKEAGCVKIGFGIESGNQEILNAIKKDIKLSDAENAINMAKKAGLKTWGYFIIGHPNETIQTINDTIDFAAKLNTTVVAFGIMVPYPGTEIYDMAIRGDGNYKIISQNWEDYDKLLGNVLELNGISRDELESMQHKAYVRFYMRNFRILAMALLILKERKLFVRMIKKKLFS